MKNYYSIETERANKVWYFGHRLSNNCPSDYILRVKNWGGDNDLKISGIEIDDENGIVRLHCGRLE